MGDGLNEHFLLWQSKLLYALRLVGAEKLNISFDQLIVAAISVKNI